MRDIALEVPTASVAIGWLTKRNDACLTRAEVLDDAFDEVILACGATPFDQHQDLVVAPDEMLLQLDQLDSAGCEAFFDNPACLGLRILAEPLF